MSRIAWFVGVLLVALMLEAPALAAQDLEGTGQQATELFALDAGLAVFDLEHHGTGDFLVRLLDEQGRVVEVLAQGTGNFDGSKAVSVPRAGRYLLDVSATGHWTVRRRAQGAVAPSPQGTAATSGTVVPDTASPVYKSAVAAASRVPTNGWLARGFVGGVVAGPIGAAVAVGLAGRSGIPTASADGGANGDPGYEQAFAARVRELRKKKAFVGGMLGSGVLIAGLIYLVDIAEGGKGGAPGGGGPVEPGLWIGQAAR